MSTYGRTELKARMTPLLESPTSLISDICSSVLLVASREGGSVIGGEKRKLFVKTVDAVMEREHVLFKTVHNLFAKILRGRLVGKHYREEFLKQNRVDWLEKELGSLLDFVERLFRLNWQVYSAVYTAAVSDE